MKHAAAVVQGQMLADRTKHRAFIYKQADGHWKVARLGAHVPEPFRDTIESFEPGTKYREPGYMYCTACGRCWRFGQKVYIEGHCKHRIIE